GQGCASDSECGGTRCDPATHHCSPSYCDPGCEDWQVCASNACVAASGRCGYDGECKSPETPTCLLDTHLCAAPATTPAWTESAVAVIVTSDALASSFQRLARLHTLTGIPTRVVTLSEICAGTTCNDTDPRQDTPKAIKDYLKKQPGLVAAVIGGDIED